MNQKWKQQLNYLKREAYTLYYACQDRKTPWYAKLLGALVVAYAFSPIDLIPDFIPIIGFLDDLLISPLGVFFVSKLIPKKVMELSRERAEAAILADDAKPKNWIAAACILLIWLVFASLVILYFLRKL